MSVPLIRPPVGDVTAGRSFRDYVHRLTLAAAATPPLIDLALMSAHHGASMTGAVELGAVGAGAVQAWAPALRQQISSSFQAVHRRAVAALVTPALLDAALLIAHGPHAGLPVVAAFGAAAAGMTEVWGATSVAAARSEAARLSAPGNAVSHPGTAQRDAQPPRTGVRHGVVDPQTGQIIDHDPVDWQQPGRRRW